MIVILKKESVGGQKYVFLSTTLPDQNISSQQNILITEGDSEQLTIAKKKEYSLNEAVEKVFFCLNNGYDVVKPKSQNLLTHNLLSLQSRTRKKNTKLKSQRRL